MLLRQNLFDKVRSLAYSTPGRGLQHMVAHHAVLGQLGDRSSQAHFELRLKGLARFDAIQCWILAGLRIYMADSHQERNRPTLRPVPLCARTTFSPNASDWPGVMLRHAPGWPKRSSSATAQNTAQSECTT